MIHLPTKKLLNKKECSACGKEVANHLQKLLKGERTRTDVTSNNIQKE
jgi:hypothetical protein